MNLIKSQEEFEEYWPGDVADLKVLPRFPCILHYAPRTFWQRLFGISQTKLLVMEIPPEFRDAESFFSGYVNGVLSCRGMLEHRRQR